MKSDFYFQTSSKVSFVQFVTQAKPDLLETVANKDISQNKEKLVKDQQS